MSNKIRLKKENMNMMVCSRKRSLDTSILYHYTKSLHLESIIISREIKVEDLCLEKNQRPAAWLSRNNQWEETVRIDIIERGKIRSLSRDEFSYVGLVPIRFLIDTESLIIHPWNRFKKVSRISKRGALALESVGRTDGADPQEWYASFVPITIASWLAIEYWDGVNWKVLWFRTMGKEVLNSPSILNFHNIAVANGF